MQASPVLRLSPRSFNSYSDEDQFVGKIVEDFSEQVKIVASDHMKFENNMRISEDDQVQQQSQHENEEEEQEEPDEEDGDEDFSFVCNVAVDPSSPISADDIFRNGEIRPVFPLFNQDLLLLLSDHEDVDSDKTYNSRLRPHRRPPLKKVFIETDDTPLPPSSSESDDIDGVADGPYCAWSKGKVIEASPEVCKKSNSTGFSKLWRFGDFANRSHSDGRDAFVFLNNTTTTKAATSVKREEKVAEKKPEKIKTGELKANVNGVGGGEKIKKAKKKVVKAETSSLSAYMKNRAMDEDRRKSYLPYRPGLLGSSLTSTAG
ncbi:unnamed protein product [Ilex paraguariensis]|uniref:Uncharacterized protein n=1 Tax=Ilex paraguariensis TaxID=185542 RepID=A0ABC8UNW6_9AQUA